MLTFASTPELDAGLLLARVLGKPRSYLFGHPDAALDAEAGERFRELVARRCDGEPVAYLTGSKGFWSLDLEVGPAVLVPRPETELLVELALDRIPADADWRVADLGTGSGAIALALAVERPCLAVTATDADPKALMLAQRNAERLGLARMSRRPPATAADTPATDSGKKCGLGNVAFRQGNWFDAFGENERFHLLVSNPPYVAENDPHLAALGHEPRAALVAGGDGLDALRRIIAGAPARLLPGGHLLLEHGADQGSAVHRLLADAGFEEIETHPDLAGHPRATTARGKC